MLPLAALVLRLPPGRLIPSLSSPQVVQAVTLSLATTLVTTVVTVCFGTPVGYLLARRRFRFRRVVDTLVDLPTVLPPAVAGVGLLMAFGRRGILGGTLDAWGIQIAFTWVAVVMAQTFVASAFYVKAAALGFASIDPELEQSAALDGASSWQVFRHVTLPLASAALLSGAVMTWARALGEFGATIIFAGNYPGRTQTMPLAIYLGFELDLNVALTLAVILIALLVPGPDGGERHPPPGSERRGWGLVAILFGCHLLDREPGNRVESSCTSLGTGGIGMRLEALAVPEALGTILMHNVADDARGQGAEEGHPAHGGAPGPTGRDGTRHGGRGHPGGRRRPRGRGSHEPGRRPQDRAH